MHGWMLSSNAIMLYEYCKSNHCVFHSSVINDCISWCRYPSEMGVKFTGFRTYHSYNRLHFNKLFYECIILWYTLYANIINGGERFRWQISPCMYIIVYSIIYIFILLTTKWNQLAQSLPYMINCGQYNYHF